MKVAKEKIETYKGYGLSDVKDTLTFFPSKKYEKKGIIFDSSSFEDSSRRYENFIGNFPAKIKFREDWKKIDAFEVKKEINALDGKTLNFLYLNPFDNGLIDVDTMYIGLYDCDESRELREHISKVQFVDDSMKRFSFEEIVLKNPEDSYYSIRIMNYRSEGFQDETIGKRPEEVLRHDAFYSDLEKELLK